MLTVIGEQHKIALDYAAGGITVATIIGWLPNMAAAATFVYMLIRIWESATCRRLLRAVCARCAEWLEAGK